MVVIVREICPPRLKMYGLYVQAATSGGAARPLSRCYTASNGWSVSMDIKCSRYVVNSSTGNWARNSGLAPLFRSMMKSMISLLLITHFLNKRPMISILITESSVMGQECLNRPIKPRWCTGNGLAQDTGHTSGFNTLCSALQVYIYADLI